MNILKVLKDKNYLENVKTVERSNCYKVVFILRNGVKVPLSLYFYDDFPYKLPEVLIDIDVQSYIPKKPHIASNGYICYLDKEGITWNDIPEVTMDYVFLRIEKVLLDKISEEDIHREFMYYFSCSPNCRTALSIVKSSSNLRQIKVLVNKDKYPMLFYNTQEKQLEKEKKKVNVKEKQEVNAVYIPLNSKLNLYVPNEHSFWSQKEISQLIKASVSEKTIKELIKCTKNKNTFYYVLDIPLATGENVLIGLQYFKKYDGAVMEPPIISEKQDYDIIPIELYRFDDTKILTRGGAAANGKEFNILLIGCGSVGSDLLFTLARSGFKKFTLVDPDKIHINNTYRHFLGKNKTLSFKSKVELLKEEMDDRYSELEISIYDDDIFDLLRNNKIKIESFDIVISAIGDTNKERLLNKYIIKTKTPAIFTWVEAYGIGGHALLVNNDKTGCYNCYIRDDLTNEINFAGKSDKPFVKNIDGCLGTFTPYGSMDSMQTATIAARLCYDLLNRKIVGNKIVSWKGNENEFVSQGFTLDQSYHNLQGNMGTRTELEIRSCKICNERH